MGSRGRFILRSDMNFISSCAFDGLPLKESLDSSFLVQRIIYEKFGKIISDCFHDSLAIKAYFSELIQFFFLGEKK